MEAAKGNDAAAEPRPVVTVKKTGWCECFHILNISSLYQLHISSYS